MVSLIQLHDSSVTASVFVQLVIDVKTTLKPLVWDSEEQESSLPLTLQQEYLLYVHISSRSVAGALPPTSQLAPH